MRAITENITDEEFMSFFSTLGDGYAPQGVLTDALHRLAASHEEIFELKEMIYELDEVVRELRRAKWVGAKRAPGMGGCDGGSEWSFDNASLRAVLDGNPTPCDENCN